LREEELEVENSESDTFNSFIYSCHENITLTRLLTARYLDLRGSSSTSLCRILLKLM
jgi:hypothetical protein